MDLMCSVAQISDDEDDTHPNIDTPSLFRWRHQARMERMERDAKEKEEFQKGFDEYGLSTVQGCHFNGKSGKTG